MDAIVTSASQSILDCEFDAVNNDRALAWANEAISGTATRYITTVNVAILMMMRKDARLKSFISQSDLTVADGQPIIWLSKLLRRPLPERVTGIDLCSDIAAQVALKGKSIYLLGGSDDVLKLTEKKLLAVNPELTIAGRHNGYFKAPESGAIVKDINQSKADILFVGMGVPRQEYFLQDNLSQLNVKLAIALGGSFDVISGAKQRAPIWMQKSGLEWLFRLIQEPRRLAKRYVMTNTQFLALSFKALFNRNA